MKIKLIADSASDVFKDEANELNNPNIYVIDS